MRRLVPIALALAAASVAGAQGTTRPAASLAKRPLTQDTYDSWRTIQQPALSPDGEWVAYTLTPVVGDGWVTIAAARGARQEWRIPRGWTGRPQLQPNADSGWSAPAVQWSADGTHAAWLAYATGEEFERARRARRRPADQPKASLVIQPVRRGERPAPVTVASVRSFRLPRERGGWMAYHLEADSARRDSSAARDTSARPGVAAATPGGTPRPVGDSLAAREPRRETGTTLVLRELATGREVRIPDVTAYALSDSGTWIGYTVAGRDRARDGAYLRRLGGGDEVALLTGAGSYRGLAFDRAERQVVFVTDRDDLDRRRPRRTLYHATLPKAGTGDIVARPIVTPAALGGDLRVADRGTGFTRDGRGVLLGITGPALDTIPADSLADKAVLDLWHWKDTRLQPQQRLEASRDRDRAYTAVWRTDTRRLVRVADDTIPNATVSDDASVALATTSLPYAVEAMWGEGGTDAYLVDLKSGARRRIAERLPFQPSLSPGARYVAWFRDGHWFTHDVRTGATVDATAALKGVRLDQETWDTPSRPAPWGAAGWTAGDRSLLVYSRYDVWELDPAGRRAPRNVTDSAGARARQVLRVVDLDPEARWVDDELLLGVFDEKTKGSGFARDRVTGSEAPRTIVMADARFGAPQRARRGTTLLLTRQTLREFPDLHAGARLDSLVRISDANPQQAQHAWADVELVSWTGSDGTPLEGLLYRPEGWDPARKYPMVVYFYETHAENLHQHYAPSGRNVINPVVWASRGYLVFMPDIAYTEGYPGQSALHSIVPGVQALVARGIVDPQRIGITGQSWGGYQTAFIVTQTPLFRAAAANAPVANMTSAYGGIRWESGMARPFQYEKGQSRIGGDPWRYPMRYIENSPLFFADRVKTPMFIMHNDADGAVPWQQGIELFVALRRLGKEVYLVNYNGDGHNPRKRANQKDVDLRMQQFFDHHLKGDPAPEWMRKGIPFLQKGRDQLAPAPTPSTVTTAAPAESPRP